MLLKVKEFKYDISKKKYFEENIWPSPNFFPTKFIISHFLVNPEIISPPKIVIRTVFKPNHYF